MVAPTGNNVPQAWQGVLSGQSAVAPITQFDASGLPVRFAAEVKGFDATRFLDRKTARQSSRFVQFALAAVREALDDSGLDVSVDADRYGCAMGVGAGAWCDIDSQSRVLQQHGPRRVSPHFFPYTLPNMAAGLVSVFEGLRGPNLCTATACASGNHALGEASMHIAMGTAEVMVAGGAESFLGPLYVAAFAQMRALSTRNDDPARASRPFDRDRDGFVMGEGSGALVLEEFEHARRRGAAIYAELLGYGLSCDAHHATLPPPTGDGAARAMLGCLKSADIVPDQVDYINAHGSSTVANDSAESAAIEAVFGDHARRLSVSSTKGATGHCLGAAGAIEAVFAALAVHHGLVPPTANYEKPDPKCRLDYTPNQPRQRSIRCALTNSFGFGGQNAVIAFGPPP
jgi:3-oxoacyl-[acyl-carrier-protein] synthase II